MMEQKTKLVIKKEVRELCVQLRNTLNADSDEFKRIEDVLKRKYKFTAWNLLALFENPPTIEYNDDNSTLVTEEVDIEK